MNQFDPITKRLLLTGGIALGTLLLGTAGYMLIEDWDFFDGFYMTVITLTTAGHREVHDLSTAGRTFTIFLLLFSFGFIAYSATTIARFLLEGELRELLQGRRMDKSINAMEGHIILCGGGRTGQHIITELAECHQGLVVIESNPETARRFSEENNVHCVVGDSTEDEILIRAGIKRAMGLIACIGNDRDNVFIVLSARDLNKNLRIIARLNDVGNEEKLFRAGADELVSPNAIGGKRMVAHLIEPAAVSFIESLLHAGEQKLFLREVSVPQHSRLVNKTLAESHIGKHTNTLVLGVHRNGHYQFRPGGQYIIQEQDSLIVMGTLEEIDELHKYTDRKTTLL